MQAFVRENTKGAKKVILAFAHTTFTKLYPEAFNPQVVGIIRDYNFVPTELSGQNVLNEGKKPENIYVVGNTAIDAGTLKLVGTDADVTYRNFKLRLKDEPDYAKMSNGSNPYGQRVRM